MPEALGLSPGWDLIYFYHLVSNCKKIGRSFTKLTGNGKNGLKHTCPWSMCYDYWVCSTKFVLIILFVYHKVDKDCFLL